MSTSRSLNCGGKCLLQNIYVFAFRLLSLSLSLSLSLFFLALVRVMSMTSLLSGSDSEALEWLTTKIVALRQADPFQPLLSESCRDNLVRLFRTTQTTSTMDTDRLHSIYDGDHTVFAATLLQCIDQCLLCRVCPQDSASRDDRSTSIDAATRMAE
jgi:hypothetical protein